MCTGWISSKTSDQFASLGALSKIVYFKNTYSLFNNVHAWNFFLTDFSNGYHLSSKGIKTFLEMPIGVEKKSQATDNRLKKWFI